MFILSTCIERFLSVLSFAFTTPSLWPPCVKTDSGHFCRHAIAIRLERSSSRLCHHVTSMCTTNLHSRSLALESMRLSRDESSSRSLCVCYPSQTHACAYNAHTTPNVERMKTEPMCKWGRGEQATPMNESESI